MSESGPVIPPDPRSGAKPSLFSARDKLLDLAAPGAHTLTAEEAEALLVAVAALEEIATVPGRSVTTLIAQRALDGRR